MERTCYRRFAYLLGYAAGRGVRVVSEWVVLTLMVVMPVSTVMADSITIGTGDLGNVIPFGSNYTSGSSIEYQQVYLASVFPRPLTITAIGFFAAGSETGILPGNWEFTLSSTSVAVGELSTNLASNITGVQSTFYNGALPASTSGAPSMLIVAGAPFYYDPGTGNLLLDIIATGLPPDTFLDPGMRVDISGSGQMSRASTDYAYPFADSAGLVTQITFNSIPEPNSLIMAAMGVAGVALYLAHRSRRARA